MRRLAFLSSALLLAGGLAFAQQPSSSGQTMDPGHTGQQMDPARPGDQAGGQPTTPVTQPESGASKSKKAESKFTADVVSVDAQANTITIKRVGERTTDTAPAGTSADNETLSVDSKAQGSLKKVGAGDRVKLVSKADESGKTVVTSIERVDTRPASGEKP